MSTPEIITFPAGVLGLDPVRVPIIGRGEEWFAVAKPGGMAFGTDLLAPEAPDLEKAMVAALAAAKPQLVNLGIEYAGRVHPVDTAASGVVILALSPKVEGRMRNAVGSRQWEFVYDVLAQSPGELSATPITCDLPLVRHGSELRYLVSHGAGKRCETVFSPVQALGRWGLWEARTRENRPHQLRVHARECELRIPGDSTYGRVPRIYLSKLKRRYRPGRGEERPLHPHLCLHLREVAMLDANGDVVHVSTPRPKSFDVLLRRLTEAVGEGRALSL